MEGDNVLDPPRVTLKDISAFLSSNHLDDKDRSESLEERTNCAIVLLQTIPCARYAVLEKIGEVFFDEAKKYVVELERLHLAGMPSLYESTTSSLDAQVRNIQQVLVSFVQGNAKAWGPFIFQWSVQMLSQICSQYATKRHFLTFTLEERFQMWLNCTATAVLLEITVSSLRVILADNQDSCVKCLVNATLTSSPYFTWALAHLCCVFPDVLPYKLLCHALDAFSKQSRRIDVIIDTLLQIFDLLHGHKKKCVEEATMKLFTGNLVNVKDKHVVLCAIPFLLHIGKKSHKLFKPLVSRILQTLTHDNLYILQEQSNHRDEVLQRRCAAIVADCVHEIDDSAHKVLQFLVKYACQEDDILIEENPMLAASTQSFCSVVLQTLVYMFSTEINVYLHYNKCEIQGQNGDTASKSRFLSSLDSLSIRHLCKQMLTSGGTRRDVLQEVLKLHALQENCDKMCDLLMYVFVNSSIHVSKSSLMYYLKEFKFVIPNIAKMMFRKAFNTMASAGYTTTQTHMFLRNVQRLDREEKCGFFQKVSVMTCLKPYVKHISQLIIQCKDTQQNISMLAMEILQKMNLSDLHVSEYATMVQAIISLYFDRLQKISHHGHITPELWKDVEVCDTLLLKTIGQYGAVHQHILRLLLEGLMQRSDMEEFSTEAEDALIKVQLFKRNMDMARATNRYNTITSVTFKDGLKLPEKCMSGTREYKQWSNTHVQQLFINTLSSLLSVTGYHGSRVHDNDMVGGAHKFMQHWGEKKYMLLYPAAHAYSATVLVELVCPEMVPVLAWPDEETLKYTMERDLKVKNMFGHQPVLWEVLELISCARPSLFHCSVLVQSLLATLLKFWQTNRNTHTKHTPTQLHNTYKILNIIRNAGWLPPQIDTISDIFAYIKPKEVYDILSCVWNYLRNTSFAPDRFMDRDQLGLPTVAVNNDCLLNLKAVIQIVFLRNIEKIGHLYHRFFTDHSS